MCHQHEKRNDYDTSNIFILEKTEVIFIKIFIWIFPLKIMNLENFNLSDYMIYNLSDVYDN